METIKGKPRIRVQNGEILHKSNKGSPRKKWRDWEKENIQKDNGDNQRDKYVLINTPSDKV